MSLPPGQHAVEGFPRFGTHLHHPAPAIPEDPVIEIAGAVNEQFVFSLAELATLPRREITADFHCVSGWSAIDLRWEGVSFETFYRRVIEPNLRSGTSVTHLVFAGFDGYRSIATIEDALAPEVLIAEHLNGLPLDSDHGAPVRLISPGQYGFISTKHLCRIEAHTAPPPENYGYANTLAAQLLLDLRAYLLNDHLRDLDLEPLREVPAGWPVDIGRVLQVRMELPSSCPFDDWIPLARSAPRRRPSARAPAN